MRVRAAVRKAGIERFVWRDGAGVRPSDVRYTTLDRTVIDL
jgi:hypothetical protein